MRRSCPIVYELPAPFWLAVSMWGQKVEVESGGLLTMCSDESTDERNVLVIFESG